MIRPTKTRIFTFCLLIAISASNAAGQSDGTASELKWKLQEGDRFEVILVQDSKSETKIDTRETTVDSATTIGMDWEVTKVAANGDATISQSLSSVQLSVTGFTRKKKGETASPLMAISFDTSAPDSITKESKKLMQQIQPLLGLKFDVTMSPQGEIKEVVVPTDIAEQLAKLPDTQQLRSLFSKNGLKDILGASAVVLPKELSAGQSWTEESETSSPLGKFLRKRTYTFVDKQTNEGKDVAKFSVSVTLSPIDNSDQPAVNDALSGKLLEFSGSGILLLDVEGGFFHFSEIGNRVHSEKPYREKIIDTVISNQIKMTVNKK